MFCKIFRYKISSELDSELNLSKSTMKHISSCSNCQEYYNKLKALDSALSDMPQIYSKNYDISRLNSRIFARLNSCSQSETLNIQYPTVRYSNKFAAAAVILIAAILSTSVYVNMTENSRETYDNTENIALVTPEKTEISNTNIAETVVNIKTDISPVFINPQMAVLYQMTAKPLKELSKLPYQEEYKESLENYEKAIRTTTKSTEIINTVLKNNAVYFLLF